MENIQLAFRLTYMHELRVFENIVLHVMQIHWKFVLSHSFSKNKILHIYKISAHWKYEYM